jgi:dipeptidyl aminopeptidase/acylaminoacyl peptidase
MRFVAAGRFLTLLVLISILLLPGFVKASAKRPLTVDDLLRLEELRESAPSPDGEWVAYTVARARAGARSFNQWILMGADHADVWIVSTKGGTPKNLTRGESDGSGFWSPVWSPDGKKLAMFSTRGGELRLWCCDLSSGQLYALTSRDAAYQRPGDRQPFVWLSNTEVACAVMPEGRRPIAMVLDTQTPAAAMREWPKQWKGSETTASVLQSGVQVSFDNRPHGQLVLIDVRERTESVIAEGNVDDICVSPDKTHIAFLKQIDVYQPRPDRLLEYPQAQAGKRFGLAIASIPATRVPSSGQRVAVLSGYSIVPNSVCWSPDGLYLAAAGMSDQSPDAASQLLRCSLARGSIKASVVPGLTPVGDGYRRVPAISWSGSEALLVLAKPSSGSDSAGGGRADWWLIERDSIPRNLTQAFKGTPSGMVATADNQSFIAVSDGDLWRIKSNEPAEKFGSVGGLPVSSIVRSRQAPDGRPGCTQIIVTAGPQRGPSLFVIDLGSNRITPLTKPSSQAEMVDYFFDGRMATFSDNTEQGICLWVSMAGGGEPRLVVRLNQFVEGIALGALKKVEYSGVDGQHLYAWLVLPPDYQEGRRYPLVVEVYGGLVYRDYPPPSFSAIDVYNWQQLLAAHGFAVLCPSMPLKPMGQVSNPYSDLPGGVLPAIDKVIEMGITGPESVGVLGHSFGGYSAYALITQTNRFKAAVAMAGISDLVSLYGSFDVRFRYEPYAHERLFYQTHSETGQNRMGSPPWKDATRYVLNSPIFHADQVQTPTMIVQGDLDFISIGQGEEFFSALHRLGKRAEFVRYWGEGHVLQSPANIRDMWRRVFNWLDQFLVRQEVAPTGSSAKSDR